MADRDDRAGISNARVQARPAARFALIVAVAVLNILLFFRHSIFSGFEQISGDPWDGRLQMIILEHWHHVWMLQANWRDPIFFYPKLGVLGYNDGYFIYGAIYSLARALGADWLMAYELVPIAIKLIGFGAFIYLSCRILRVRLAYALLGASVFFQLCSTANQLGHSQLLTVSFVPLMLIFLHRFFAGLVAGNRRDVLVFGGSAVVFYAAWLMTAFYMAWFFTFFALFAFVVYLLIVDEAGRQRLLHAVAKAWKEEAILVVVAAVALIPFCITYLPTARETGMQQRTAVLYHIGTPIDALNVGERNYLYGDLVVNLGISNPSDPANGERRTGLTPLLFFSFLAGLVYCLRRERAVDKRVLQAMVLALIVFWLLSMRWGPLVPWNFIYDFIPGAKVVRVAPRLQIFVGFFAVLAATLMFDRGRWFDFPLLFVVLAGALLLEQYDLGYGYGITREGEAWTFTTIPAPPAACRSFFVSHASERKNLSESVRDYYSHNIDAMMVAERFNLPTLNGMDSLSPSGWDLFRPTAPDYLSRVLAYAKAENLGDGLCSLDVPAAHWDVVSLPAP